MRLGERWEVRCGNGAASPSGPCSRLSRSLSLLSDTDESKQEGAVTTSTSVSALLPRRNVPPTLSHAHSDTDRDPYISSLLPLATRAHAPRPSRRRISSVFGNPAHALHVYMNTSCPALPPLYCNTPISGYPRVALPSASRISACRLVRLGHGSSPSLFKAALSSAQLLGPFKVVATGSRSRIYFVHLIRKSREQRTSL